MVTIGHARGGDPTYTPGDQGGGEVRVQNWYDCAWDFVARFRDRAMAARAARICRAVCANDEVGYSQARRNDLRAAAVRANWRLADIRRPADCDCSSLMSFCAEAAGVQNLERPGGNAPWTGNMRQLLGKTDMFDILTEDKYRKTDGWLLTGDILVNEKKHTAMALTDGQYASQEAGSSLSSSRNAVANAAATANAVATAAKPAGGELYTVIPGDTLWGIAVAHGVTVPAICAANNLDMSRFIMPGQKLIIPPRS